MNSSWCFECAVNTGKTDNAQMNFNTVAVCLPIGAANFFWKIGIVWAEILFGGKMSKGGFWIRFWSIQVKMVKKYKLETF